jgi:hypothetical protein
MINSWIAVVALTLSLAFADRVAAQAPRMQENAPTNAQPARGTWTEERPLSSPRVEVAAAAVGHTLHAVGGNRDGVAAETTHEAYDPSVNAWHMLAPLPEARDHVAVAEAGGKLFAFGGFATPVHKGASADSFEYDPAADRWRRLPPMPTARGSAAAAVVNGKIHVIGVGPFTDLIGVEPPPAQLARLRAAESSGRPLGGDDFVAELAWSNAPATPSLPDACPGIRRGRVEQSLS